MSVDPEMQDQRATYIYLCARLEIVKYRMQKFFVPRLTVQELHMLSVRGGKEASYIWYYNIAPKLIRQMIFLT